MLFYILIMLSIFFPITAHADHAEEVLSFHADLYVNTDRTLTVHETITVYSLCEKIKHGIYRILPKSYHVTNILKDNSPSASFSNLIGRDKDFQQIFIGAKTVLLAPGMHRYLIIYTTPQVIDPYYGHADNEHTHDILEWSINGRNWSLPIKKLSASIHFPANFSSIEKDFVSSTANIPGTFSMPASNLYTLSYDRNGKSSEVRFTALWKKGLLVQPSYFNEITQFLRLILSYCSILAAFLFILLHCCRLFARRNRWYKRSLHYQEYPPQNILPVEACFLTYGTVRTDGITATFIDMAQRNYFTIQKKAPEGFFSFFLSDVYMLTMQKTNDPTPLYQSLASTLFKKQKSICMSKKSEELKDIVTRIQNHCEDKHYFEEDNWSLRIAMVTSLGIVFVTCLYLNLILHEHPWPHMHFPHYKILFLTVLACLIWTVCLGKILNQQSAYIYQQLKSFKLFLLSRKTYFETDNQYGPYLAYAVALYATKKWTSIRTEESPEWYQDLTNNHHINLVKAITLFNVALIPLLPVDPVSLILQRKTILRKFSRNRRFGGRGGGGGGGSSGGGGW